MQKASSNAGTPARQDDNPYLQQLSLRSLFSWSSSKHNTCLAMAAEWENYEGSRFPLEEHIVGLQVAPMYLILRRQLQADLKMAITDDEQAYALTCFAARCYCAGQYAAMPRGENL